MRFTGVNDGHFGPATFCFTMRCGLFDLAVVKLPRGFHAPKCLDSVAGLTRSTGEIPTTSSSKRRISERVFRVYQVKNQLYLERALNVVARHGHTTFK